MPVTAPGRIIPPPLTAAARARPRDASGRVTAPIRLEAKFPSGRDYRKFFSDWDEVAGFLASLGFKQSAVAVKALTITVTDPNAGPDIITTPSWRDPRREV